MAGQAVKIRHDTERLRAELCRINEAIGRFDDHYGKLGSDLSELTSMWSGPAKDTFNAQVSIDNMIMLRTILHLRQCAKELDEICTEYEKADSIVESKIAGLR